MHHALRSLLAAATLFGIACGPAIARTPADMRNVAWYRLAPHGFDFEAEVPTEPSSTSSRDHLDGFDEPIVTTEWQVQTDDRTAAFSITHVRYPAGLLRDSGMVQRVLDWSVRYAASTVQGGRMVSRSNLRASGGVRGIRFEVRAPDRSTLEGRFLIRGDEGLLCIVGTAYRSRWESAADRTLRSLKFL